MNAETTKKLHALVRLCSEIIAEPDTAAKNAQIIKSESAPAPSSSTNEHYENKRMSRAEAVRILMLLQAIEACDGHANINKALEMAVANLIRRHRQVCRNKAKRRAAKESVASC